jgi:hypothetical protein
MPSIVIPAGIASSAEGCETWQSDCGSPNPQESSHANANEEADSNMITAQVAKIRLIFMLNPILRHLGSRLQLHQAGTEHAKRVDPTIL